MEEFKFLSHCKLHSELEKDIIALKQQHWHYSYASQTEWLHSNLNKDDMHLLLYVDGQLTAYLNLVNVSVSVGDKTISALGVGNVCVAKCKTGNGFGHKIVQKANEIIKEKNKVGVLLCKENLEGFYAKLGWHKIPCKKMSVANKDYDKTIMLFNSSVIEAEQVTVERNF